MPLDIAGYFIPPHVLPVEGLAGKDCVLFLWATYPMLQEALDVIRAWGFTFKTVAFTWIKLAPKADSISFPHTSQPGAGRRANSSTRGTSPMRATMRRRASSGFFLCSSTWGGDVRFIGKYSVIYADPPWRYQTWKGQGVAERHYPTMPLEDIKALPVEGLTAGALLDRNAE